MRNLKKFLALVLAMLMVVSAAATVSAFEDVAEDNLFADAIADLNVLDIVNGYDGETFGPEDAVTRQQFALMMARAITGVTDDEVWAQGGLVAFEDVTEYQYAIATVVKAGLVDGFLDNTFRPEEGVTFIQALKMAVCALGYDDGNLDWWQGYYNVALDLGLTENLNQIPTADYALNRGEVAQLIYNMIYVETADGNGTLFEKNFEEPAPELPADPDEATYAIVATPKQYATQTTGVTDGGFVGLQEIVAGVPSGDILYLAIDEFVEYFDATTVESFFGYTVKVLSVDGEYAGVKVLTDNVAVVEGSKITEADTKFTFENVIYYPVDEVTGSTIKNEIVVFNADKHEYIHTAKVLLLDKNGEITDKDGNVILKAVYDSKGNVVYKAFRDATGALLSATKVMDEAIATTEYGTDVESEVDSFEFLTAAYLKKSDAYQLTLFNDNPETDDIYDRAYYTPVYVGAYIPNKADGTVQMTADANLKKSVTFVADEELAKGDVIVYTYNSQLNTVTVIETLEVKRDIVEYVSTLKIKESSNPYFTFKTAEDETFTVYLSYNASKVGANLKTTTNLTASTPVTAPTKMTDITVDAKFDYVDAKALYEKLQHSMAIEYIERNGYVIFAEACNIEEDYDLVVVKEVTDIDYGSFTVEVYADGELVEIPVVALKTDDKTVDFASMSWIKQSTYLDDFIEGGVYKLVELDNGFMLNELLDYKNATTSTTDKPGKFGLYEVAYNTAVTIYNNIENNTDVANRGETLRTDEDTVWYFISGTDVKVFSGEIEYGYIPAAYIYADKLGYKADANDTDKQHGVADEVYVFIAADKLDEIKGFGVNALVAKEVYIPTIYDSRYDYDTAAAFGLDASVYTARGYYKYTEVAFDINAGEKVTIYSDTRLTSSDIKKVHTADKNGVLLNDVETQTLAEADFISTKTSNTGFSLVVDDTYVTFNDGNGNVYSYDKKLAHVYAIKDASDAAVSVKADAAAKTEIDKADVVNYKVDLEGKKIIVIYSGTKTTTTPPTALTNLNGEFGSGTATTGAGKTVTTLTSNAGLTGSITLTDMSGYQLKTLWVDSTKLDGAIKIEVEKLQYVDQNWGYAYQDYIPASALDVTAVAEKGVITITAVKNAGTNVALTLPAGNYKAIVDIAGMFSTAFEFTVNG